MPRFLLPILALVLVMTLNSIEVVAHPRQMSSGYTGNDGTCINKHRSCNHWARRKECQKNPSYMLRVCKQACNACGTLVVKEDQNRNKKSKTLDMDCANKNKQCSYWAGRGECQKQPGYMSVNCKLACNACAPTVESPGYYAVERGSLYSPNFEIFIIKNGLGPVSPFHDIPLFANVANKTFNNVVEIPRWTNAKMEINTKDYLNPIKQDIKNSKVRYIPNCHPYKGYIFNYGAMPQTWEDPNRIDKNTGQKGDKDPIDTCEIGSRIAKMGEVLQVKVLGILGLIDEGETDWKLIVIDINDLLAPQLNDISDVEKHKPGFLNAIVDWFRIYKVPNGNPKNTFAFNGDLKGREFAHNIILDSHEYWKDLIEGRSDPGGLSTKSVTVTSAANKMTSAEARAILIATPQKGQPLPLDPELDKWHYCR